MTVHFSVNTKGCEMESEQKKMLRILCELRDSYGVEEVKAEYEAEGTRTDEMVMLSEVVGRANVGLILKVGGCEAVRDIEQARLFGASTIVGPMIETPFAMKKYRGAGEKVFGAQASAVDWAINTETVTCLDNLDSILKEGDGFLSSVTIGRVDLSASMGLSRADINSNVVLEACSHIASKAHQRGLLVGMGGGISFDAIPFISQMKGLVDKFETRKISFAYTENPDHLRNGILLAMEFETLYLEGKCAYYDRLANEDRGRLQMMAARLKQARATMDALR